MHIICYFGSIMILGADCVGKVHNMLPWKYYDIVEVSTQYATLVVL